MNVGMLYSRIRTDEKLLLGELRDRGHAVEKIDVRTQSFGLTEPPAAVEDVDIVLDRCMATSRSLYATRFLESYGIPVVNSPETAEVCANKVKNSLALSEAGVPTPRTEVAFTSDAALEIVERFGYPCVLKPVVGSWGRLMAKIDSRSAADCSASTASLASVTTSLASSSRSNDSTSASLAAFVSQWSEWRVIAAIGSPSAASTRMSRPGFSTNSWT